MDSEGKVGSLMGGALGGGKGGPAAPDFGKAAQQQAASSQQVTNAQTQANRPDQTNAFGTTSQWKQNPDGSWSQATNLSGGLAQGAQALEGQIGSQGPLSTGDQARDQAISANWKSTQQMLQPQQQQQQEQLQSQLAGQGLVPGTQAANSAQTLLNNQQTLQNEQGMEGAINQGNQAQALTFGENVQAQQNPYQELGALSGLTGQQQTPYAQASQAAQYLPASMAQYQGALQNASTQQSGKNSLLSGGAGLGAAALMA